MPQRFTVTEEKLASVTDLLQQAWGAADAARSAAPSNGDAEGAAGQCCDLLDRALEALGEIA